MRNLIVRGAPTGLLGLGLLLGLGALSALGPEVVSAVQPLPTVEDFETGDLSRLPWETGGNAPWIMTPVSHGGAYAVQASKIGDGQRSWLQITFNLTQGGDLSFWLKVSSEADFDFVRLFLDGQVRGSWSGELDWQQVRFPLAAGPHNLRWEYIKDGSGAAGRDTAYLDDIAFPPTAAFAPSAMVRVPAGSFWMGDSFSEGSLDEQPAREVFLSAFFMDSFEVTKALWNEVAAWAAERGYDIGPADGDGKAPNHPVWNVSWYEAVKWANARSEKEGLTPCYYVDGERQSVVYRRGEVDLTNASVKWNADCYRLPTEAEWEKAARGGAERRRFPWSDADTIQHTRANYYSSVPYGYDTSPTRGYHPNYDNNPRPYTSPVGSFAPNGYGLFDMAGNVWEWAWDWYDLDLPLSSEGRDPRGPASGFGRVVRGGSWLDYATYVRVSNRRSNAPRVEYYGLGFRLVRTAP